MKWQKITVKYFVGTLTPTTSLVTVLLAMTISAAGQQFTIGSYYLQSSVRSSITQYDYTYKAGVYNSGGASGIIVGRVVSSNLNTLVTKSSMVIGAMPANATVNSTDTFVIRQDRRYPFNPADLSWTFSGLSSFNFGISTTRSNVNPVPFPALDRPCCGETWNNLETTRGAYSWSALDAWVSQAALNGSVPMYTFSHVPTWASKLTVADPPNDIYGSGTVSAPVAVPCQNVLSTAVTTDCQYKEFVTALMQHECNVGTQPATPLINTCGIRIYEMWNEFSGNGYWTGTFQSLAQMFNDAATIIRQYCGDCTIIGGSTSAGGDGYNPAGGSSHFDLALLDLLTRWAALPSPSLPDAVSFHPYPARTTVQPVPWPTTLVSDSSPLCATNVPSASCRAAVIDQAAIIRGSGVLSNPAISSWAANLPVWTTEGGYGLNASLKDSKNGSISGNGSVATFTSKNALPTAWITGTNVKITAGSPTGFNVTSAAITVIGSNTFTYPNATSGASTTGLATNNSLTETWVLRQAYISQWMIVLAASGTVQNLAYSYNDPCWMTFLGTGTNNGCTTEPAIPAGTTPNLTSFVQTLDWLTNSVFTGPLVSTSVGNDFIWTINMSHNGAPAQLAWFTGWQGSTSYTIPAGLNNYQTIDGTILPSGGTVMLGNRPILIY